MKSWGGAIPSKSGNDGGGLIDFSDTIISRICYIDDIGRIHAIYGYGRRTIERSNQSISILISCQSRTSYRWDGIFFFFWWNKLDFFFRAKEILVCFGGGPEEKSIFLILFVLWSEKIIWFPLGLTWTSEMWFQRSKFPIGEPT